MNLEFWLFRLFFGHDASTPGQGVSRLACAGCRSQRQTTPQEGGTHRVNVSLQL